MKMENRLVLVLLGSLLSFSANAGVGSVGSAGLQLSETVLKRKNVAVCGALQTSIQNTSEIALHHELSGETDLAQGNKASLESLLATFNSLNCSDKLKAERDQQTVKANSCAKIRQQFVRIDNQLDSGVNQSEEVRLKTQRLQVYDSYRAAGCQ